MPRNKLHQRDQADRVGEIAARTAGEGGTMTAGFGSLRDQHVRARTMILAGPDPGSVHVCGEGVGGE
ncbi:hypothetical protein CJ179_11950 [Rhodococcus sp. ACS1]|nr:hypothetical protein CJ179_11950 [Rhodococcus sp. ACS1]